MGTFPVVENKKAQLLAAPLLILLDID